MSRKGLNLLNDANEKEQLLKYANIAFIVSIACFIAYITLSKLKSTERDKNHIELQSPNVLKDSIVDFGMEYLGTPYVASGCGKDGFDCSGFVFFVFEHFKIQVPRSSVDFEHFGKEITIEDVQKGDLLLFLSPTRNVIGHIGIVSNPKGKDSDFIHASSGREMKVIVSNLSTKGYKDRFVKAVRPL
ncbi:MAG TPA: C40 family peptidase [Flavobacterium sp.]